MSSFGNKPVIIRAQNGETPCIYDKHYKFKIFQTLLNLLAENRQLTTIQYDRLIKYLQDRKEIQKQQEHLEGEEKAKSDETEMVDSKQAELQSRIMNILNNKSTIDEAKPTPTNTVSSTPTPLLDDPSVQRALDSLLTGDMFKSIAGGK